MEVWSEAKRQYSCKLITLVLIFYQTHCSKQIQFLYFNQTLALYPLNAHPQRHRHHQEQHQAAASVLVPVLVLIPAVLIPAVLIPEIRMTVSVAVATTTALRLRLEL